MPKGIMGNGDWGFRCFSDTEGNNTNKWVYTLVNTVILDQSRRAQSMKTNNRYNRCQSIYSISINRLILENDENRSPRKLWVSIFIDFRWFSSLVIDFIDFHRYYRIFLFRFNLISAKNVSDEISFVCDKRKGIQRKLLIVGAHYIFLPL